MTVKDRPQIDYAPASPIQRVRRARFLVYALLLIGVLVPLGWKCGPRVCQRVQLLYWQRKAMRYTAPPGSVVYDGDGKHAPAGEHPFFWPAREWRTFYALCSPPGRHGLPTVFVHELRSPSGNTRLVAVEGPSERPKYDYSLDLTATVLQPGSPFWQPTELSSARKVVAVGPEGELGMRSLHIFAGQPDQSDPSHFTVEFELNGKPGKLEGWLLDDDTVRLERRVGAGN